MGQHSVLWNISIFTWSKSDHFERPMEPWNYELTDERTDSQVSRPKTVPARPQ